jgi:bifunctional non-homologous end joining protein LigD
MANVLQTLVAWNGFRVEDTLVTPSISALELQQIDVPFDHPDWIFEIKFDGFRSLAYVENGKCNLVSRKENAFKRFPDLRIALPNDLKGVTEAVLDGEIVVLDERGASLFGTLMSSNSKPVYAAFDLVWLNGEDLSDLPLLGKKRLRSIVRKNASRVL